MIQIDFIQIHHVSFDIYWQYLLFRLLEKLVKVCHLEIDFYTSKNLPFFKFHLPNNVVFLSLFIFHGINELKWHQPKYLSIAVILVQNVDNIYHMSGIQHMFIIGQGLHNFGCMISINDNTVNESGILALNSSVHLASWNFLLYGFFEILS